MAGKNTESNDWLCKNRKALSQVQKGIAEARQGRHVPSPNLAAAAKLVAKIKH